MACRAIRSTQAPMTLRDQPVADAVRNMPRPQAEGRAATRLHYASVIGAWVDLTRGTPFLVQIFLIFFICRNSASSSMPSPQGSRTDQSGCLLHLRDRCRRHPLGADRAGRGGSGVRPVAMAAHAPSGLPQAMRIVPAAAGRAICAGSRISVVSAIGLTDLTRGRLAGGGSACPTACLVFFLVRRRLFHRLYPLIMLARRLERRMGAAHGEVQL